jgi:hypothetical protein
MSEIHESSGSNNIQLGNVSLQVSHDDWANEATCQLRDDDGTMKMTQKQVRTNVTFRVFFLSS